jgi:uracil phosphoribosyltransferase
MKTLFLFLCFVFPLSVHSQSQALQQLVYEIRNPQTDAAQFRKSLESIGEYLALEALEELPLESRSITTLTGKEASHFLLSKQPVLVTILRAGLPLNSGVHKVFPLAEVGFLAMARNEETLAAETSYIVLPDIQDRFVILSDTMLATGGSIIDALAILKKHNPKAIFIITAIAAQKGIDRVLEKFPEVKIFSAAVDPLLNEKGYIVPGLGDAGDRCYGKKR